MARTHEWCEGADPALPDVPSAAFGISCALAELDGSLPDAANYRAAPLCTGDPDELFALLSGMPGEKVAKIKVGLYEAVRDGMVVNLLLEAIPDLHLRLDANRASTPLRAQQFAKYVNPAYRSRIAFLEEPCKTRDDSRAFARETGIAIARDESLREADFAFAAEPGVRAVVIKPTLTGSLDKVREQVAAAHAAGLTAVISSSIESSLADAVGAHCCMVNAGHRSRSRYAKPDAGPADSPVARQHLAVPRRRGAGATAMSFTDWPWRHWRTRRADKPALRLDDITLSWSQLGERIDRLAAGFQSQGVTDGDGVMLLAHNHPQTLLARLALLQCGARILPVNPQLPRPLLDVLLPQMTLRFALVLNGEYDGLPALALREDEGQGGVTWRAERLASMTLTSGSTGLPKAAVHTCAAHLASAKGCWR